MCQYWHFPQMAHAVCVDHAKDSATGYQTNFNPMGNPVEGERDSGLKLNAIPL